MPEVKVVIVALLVVGLTLAMAGPAPRSSRPYEAILLGVLAGGFYLVAAAVAIEVSVHLGTLLIAPGVLVFCISCWLSRGVDQRGDDWGGGGGGGDDPEPDMPIDWSEFDRLRGEWSRTPIPA
jgi:hypothetical protein